MNKSGVIYPDLLPDFLLLPRCENTAAPAFCCPIADAGLVNNYVEACSYRQNRIVAAGAGTRDGIQVMERQIGATPFQDNLDT
jgi:hypothetical protein